MYYKNITSILEEKAESLLSFKKPKISKDLLNVPGPDFIDRVMKVSDRSPTVQRNLQTLFNHGRLSGTGYISILPVDQGIEHTGGVSFAPRPDLFDPKNIVELAMEGGCNAVVSSLGALASVSRSYAHKIPFIVKLNHNELMTYPQKYDQVFFGSVKQAFELGAVGIGATIYYGSEQSSRQIQEVSQAFEMAHDLGMFTVLWCYARNSAFKTDSQDYHAAADVVGQANHLGVTIKADIIKQKLSTTNYGFRDLNFAKYSDQMYENLLSDHPIDMSRYQVMNCFMGRSGLINSGGGSGKNDLQQAVETAVINKRGGGMGMISGRKAFMKSTKEGIKLLNAIQNVYLEPKITIA